MEIKTKENIEHISNILNKQYFAKENTSLDDNSGSNRGSSLNSETKIQTGFKKRRPKKNPEQQSTEANTLNHENNINSKR